MASLICVCVCLWLPACVCVGVCVQEANIMLRPPRDIKRDRLMSLSLMVYCYAYSSLANVVAIFISYILVLNHYDLTLTDVFQATSTKNFIPNPDPFRVGNRIYSPDEQMKILGALQAGVYFNLVFCQVRECAVGVSWSLYGVVFVSVSSGAASAVCAVRSTSVAVSRLRFGCTRAPPYP